MARQFLAVAYVSGIFLAAAFAANYTHLIVFHWKLRGGAPWHWFGISILSGCLCFYSAWKLYRLAPAWSLTFVGAICLMCAVLCIVAGNYPESANGGLFVPIAFIAISFAGTSVAIADVVRKQRVLSAWTVCIGNLALLLPYLAIRTVVHFF